MSLPPLDTARWDIPSIAAVFGTSEDAVASELGIPSSPASHDALELRQRVLLPIARTLAMLHDFYGGDIDRVRAWLRCPHPFLGGRLPVDVMLAPGGANGIEQLVLGGWLGDPS